jgi:hypothetical protein
MNVLSLERESNHDLRGARPKLGRLRHLDIYPLVRSCQPSKTQERNNTGGGTHTLTTLSCGW